MSAMNRLMRTGALMMLVLGCERPDPVTESAISVRDSAGVTIVEHPIELAEAATVVTLGDPLLSYGSGPSDYLFEFIVDGALLPDGSVVVADAGTSEVVRIAADGSDHVVLAGSGQGPSEVLRPVSVLSLGGDSVLIEDDGNAKFLTFAGSELVRQSSVAASGQPAHALKAHAVGDEGHLLMTTSSYRSDAGTGWIPGYMVEFDPEELIADTVASFDMAVSRPRDGPQNPFAAGGRASAASTGFVYGRSDRPELIWRERGGRVVRVVRWDAERSFPDESDLARFMDWLRVDLARVNPQMSGEQLEESLQRQIDQFELVRDEPLSLYREVADHGPDGVWLADFSPDHFGLGSESYTVVSQDGRSMHRVVFPIPTRVLDVGHGLILGAFEDELDVHHIVLYRLTTP